MVRGMSRSGYFISSAICITASVEPKAYLVIELAHSEY